MIAIFSGGGGGGGRGYETKYLSSYLALLAGCQALSQSVAYIYDSTIERVTNGSFTGLTVKARLGILCNRVFITGIDSYLCMVVTLS